MEIISIVNFFIFLIVSLRIFWGIDIKDPRSWLIGIYGFFSGALIGVVFIDLRGGLKLGLLLFLGVMFTGMTIRMNRERFKGK